MKEASLKTLLRESAAQLEISLTDVQLDQFMAYKELLIQWNEKMNLTAITEDREVILKHFVDSLSAVSGLDITGKTAVDVGSGAGFPGLPIKIACPGVEMTLLDSLQKRIGFLGEVKASLGLTGLELIHSRAEDGGRDPDLREQFDYCFSRAVAALPVLLEYCLPFVKVGGSFFALKGPALEEELKSAEKAIKSLGGRLKTVKSLPIPNSDRIHTLVEVEKISKTPTKYPRKAGLVKKNPIS